MYRNSYEAAGLWRHVEHLRDSPTKKNLKQEAELMGGKKRVHIFVHAYAEWVQCVAAIRLRANRSANNVFA